MKKEKVLLNFKTKTTLEESEDEDIIEEIEIEEINEEKKKYSQH